MLRRRGSPDFGGRLGVRVFVAITSPCSVMRIAPCTAPRAGRGWPGSSARRRGRPSRRGRETVAARLRGAGTLRQRPLGLVQLPAGGQVTAILVAVGIAEHDLLGASSAIDQCRYTRNPRRSVHHPAATAKSSMVSNNGTNRVERSVARRRVPPPLAAPRFRECRRHRRLGDHVMGHPSARNGVRFGGSARIASSPRGLGGIGTKRRTRDARCRAPRQQTDARGFGEGGVVEARLGEPTVRPTHPPCTSEF